MAHIRKSPVRKVSGRTVVKDGMAYRGVRLQEAKGQSRFTPEQVKEAVKAAISKNADALAGRFKA